MEERLVEVEMKVTFQERTVQALSDAMASERTSVRAVCLDSAEFSNIERSPWCVIIAPEAGRRGLG